MVRVDCHLHTVASGDAVLTLDELADRARRAGLDVVCITDHNVTSAAVAATERDLGIRIVVGEEIRTPDGDLIGLFLTERIPYVLPVAEVVGRIRAQGGLVYAPHPFDPLRSSLGRVLPGLCAAGAVDIIEVFNAKTAEQAPNERPLPWPRPMPCPAGPDRTRTTLRAWAPPTWRCPTSTARPASWPRWPTRASPASTVRTPRATRAGLRRHSPIRVASRSR
jgi:PHP domain-containing protein